MPNLDVIREESFSVFDDLYKGPLLGVGDLHEAETVAYSTLYARWRTEWAGIDHAELDAAIRDGAQKVGVPRDVFDEISATLG